MLESGHLLGNDLKLQMEAYVEEHKKEIDLSRAQANGDWLDEIDLREKYSKKPDQLKNIMESAESFMHPIRKVLL